MVFYFTLYVSSRSKSILKSHLIRDGEAIEISVLIKEGAVVEFAAASAEAKLTFSSIAIAE